MKSIRLLASCGAVLAAACATTNPAADLAGHDGGGGAPAATGGATSGGSGTASSTGGVRGDGATGGASAGGRSTAGASSRDGSVGGSTGGALDDSADGASESDGSAGRGFRDAASSDASREGSAVGCGPHVFDGGHLDCAGEWVRQFGGPNEDGALSVAVDGSGNAYVVGVIGGQLPGGPAIAGGSFDAYVRKYGANGLVMWTRQFGSSGDDVADSVAVDASGNVCVAGSVGGALPDQAALGASDVFVRKYDDSGNELWTRQFGSSGYDTGRVTVDGGGNVIVSGLTEGGLQGQSGLDAGSVGYVFVRKYDGAGTELWSRQFGGKGAQSGDSANVAGAANVDGSGNIYFAGTTDGTLPGQTSAGGEDAFLRKYDGAGTELWTRQFGTSESDGGSAVSADRDGNVYVAGRTFGAFPSEANAGYADAFVRKYDGSGTEVWTRQFGTDTVDAATAVQVDGAGVVYLGGATSGALPGKTSAGSTDAFVREYDASGFVLGTRQLGTTGVEQDVSLSVAPGALYVAGQTNGAFRPNMGSFDAFLVRLAR